MTVKFSNTLPRLMMASRFAAASCIGNIPWNLVSLLPAPHLIELVSSYNDSQRSWLNVGVATTTVNSKSHVPAAK